MKIRIHSESITFICFNCKEPLDILIDGEDRLYSGDKLLLHEQMSTEGLSASNLALCNCGQKFEVTVDIKKV